MKKFLTIEERDSVLCGLRGVWGFGLLGTESEKVVGFKLSEIEKILGHDWFVKSLTDRGVQLLYEIEDTYSEEDANLDLYKNYLVSPNELRVWRSEDLLSRDVIWTSESFDWVVFVSGNEFLNVGGWMLERLKATLPDWKNLGKW